MPSLVIAETIGLGLEHVEGFHVGLALRGVRAPGRRAPPRVTGSLGRCFDCCAAGQHDEVRQGDFLPPDCARLNERWMLSSVLST